MTISREDMVRLLRSGQPLSQRDRDAIADMLIGRRYDGFARADPPVIISGRGVPQEGGGGGGSGRTMPGFKPIAVRTAACAFRREGDEHTCSTCGLRWPVDEDRPACPRLDGEPTA